MNPINMKRILSLTLFSAAILASVAQGVPTAVVGQQIEVSYKYSHPVQTMRSAAADVTNDYILITDGYNSKFYSPRTEMIDSIESTPEGFEYSTHSNVNVGNQVDRKTFRGWTALSISLSSLRRGSFTLMMWRVPQGFISWNLFLR